MLSRFLNYFPKSKAILYYPLSQISLFTSKNTSGHTESLENIVAANELNGPKLRNILSKYTSNMGIQVLDDLMTLMNKQEILKTTEKDIWNNIEQNFPSKLHTPHEKVLALQSLIKMAIFSNGQTQILAKLQNFVFNLDSSVDFSLLSQLSDIHKLQFLNVVLQYKLIPYELIEQYAMNSLRKIMKRDDLEANIVQEILLLPKDFLLKSKNELENSILNSSLAGLSFLQKLNTISRIIEIYEEFTPSILVEKFFDNAIDELEIQPQRPKEDFEKILETIQLLQKAVPYYYIGKTASKRITTACKNILKALLESNVKPECFTKIRNALYTFETRADEMLNIFPYIEKNIGKLSRETRQKVVSDMLDYLTESNYSFDSVINRNYYVTFFKDFIELRKRRLVCVGRLYEVCLKKPEKFKDVLIQILSHPTAMRILEISGPSNFVNSLEFVKKCIEEYNADPNNIEKFKKDFLDMVRNFNVALIANELNLPKELDLDKLSILDIKKYEINLSKYVEIIYAPCLDKVPKILEIRKKLENSNLISLINSLHFDQEGKIIKNSEMSSSKINHLIPLYFHIGKPEEVQVFLNLFTEIPGNILSNLTPTELRKFLLLCIHHHVFLIFHMPIKIA